MNCRLNYGKCEPLVNGVKKESLEPCGSVLGVWQANRSGRILQNTLMISAPDQKVPVPFDSEILQKLIKRLDSDLMAEKI